MRIPRVYIEKKITSEEVIPLSEDKTHHILRVLRLNVGDQLKLFDNSGFEYNASIIEKEKKTILIEVGERRSFEDKVKLEIILCLAVLHGSQMDFSIQKAVELGVKSVIPIISEFSNVKLAGNQMKNKMLHWEKIIIGAAEQCGRNILTNLQNPISFRDCINIENDSTKIILHPYVELTMSKINLKNNKIYLMIGPEGGFSNSEIQEAIDNSFIPINLGPRVLRTETAVVCSLGNAQQLWGDLN